MTIDKLSEYSDNSMQKKKGGKSPFILNNQEFSSSIPYLQAQDR